MTSLLKAWWGENAQPDAEGGYCYNYLPKKSGSHDHMSIFEDMYMGKVEGMILWGQNPAVGGPNSNKERDALGKLKWMVEIETGKSISKKMVYSVKYPGDKQIQGL